MSLNRGPEDEPCAVCRERGLPMFRGYVGRGQADTSRGHDDPICVGCLSAEVDICDFRVLSNHGHHVYSGTVDERCPDCARRMA